MEKPAREPKPREVRQVSLCLPDGDEEDFIRAAIERADHYVKTVRWPSHQSVYKAVLDSFQVVYPVETLRLLCGFTAGGGFTGGLCGALSGGAAALGFIYGLTHPMPDPVYRRFMGTIFEQGLTPGERVVELIDTFWREGIYNHYFEAFRHKFGHTDCRELIRPFQDNPISKERFVCCRRIVGETAGLAVRTVLAVEKDGPMSMGKNIYSHLL
ncbi:MAG: C-GCAxxG-C-C family protein [Bacillota bacterium]